MTINLFYITRDFAVCVTDRRLTRSSGSIVSDRAKKIFQIQCKDAQIIAAFNGYAGRNMKDSPIDWILRAKEVSNMNLIDLIPKIKKILENNLNNVREELGRLSLTLTGYWQGKPVLIHISNYEHLQSKNVLEKVKAPMKTEWFTDDFIFVQTGSFIKSKESALLTKAHNFFKRGADRNEVKTMLLKAARDVPYLGKRSGVVGTNCHSVVLDAKGGYTAKPHTVGGATLIEAPDFIGLGSTFTEIMIDTNPSEEGPAWGHPETRNYVKLTDLNCPDCGNPIPTGNKQCGVCDYRLSE